MRSLVPHPIYRYMQSKRRRGSFHAATLFVDIAGFTALTETLMQHRKDGAEVLTDVLQSIFTPLVHQVYEHGGFVSLFAGDAFTAIFPLRRKMAARHAAQLAIAIQHMFAEYGTVETTYGTFSLGAKVGLGYGKVYWSIPGLANQLTFLFSGPAVAACTLAETFAEAGEIIASPPFVDALTRLGTAFQRNTLPATNNFVRLESLTRHTFRTVAPPIPPTQDMLRPFILNAVLELDEIGAVAEFRNVVVVFLSFDEHIEQHRLNTFVTEVISLAAIYGGYFNKLDIADKGGTMLILFGAPLAHENDIVRAANFVLHMKERITDVRWRAGFTAGLVYAGFIGGDERCEYTAIGDVVNLAARLMMQAPWGDIWTDPLLAHRLRLKDYRVDPVGVRMLKGKRAEVHVSRLVDRYQETQERFTSTLVGYDAEIAYLDEWLIPVLHNTCPGIMIVYGEPGLGKSRLLHELKQQFKELYHVIWRVCQTDEIVRPSLNPFRNFLYQYFDQSPTNSHIENKERFDTALNLLITTMQKEHEELASELDRLRSFLGALINIHWDRSLYERLEPELRFQNTLQALATLFQAESVLQPVIVQIEDLHWIDTDTQQCLTFLSRTIVDYPFALVCSSRYQSDGSQVSLTLADEMPLATLALQPLALSSVKALAEQIVHGTVSNHLVEFLADKTAGNPFFVEQLALELRDSESILRDAQGMWHIQTQQLETIPFSINAVLLARLDRLVMQVRYVVQVAAVLGREFEIQVLSQMLHHDVELTVKVHQAERSLIWNPMNNLRYIFRHSLLRDIAYDMQLRIRLQELHLLAAKSIEQVYALDLAPHYAELVYHSAHAQDAERELHYTYLAGEQAAATFSNIQAEQYLSRALELISADDSDRRYQLLTLREQVCDMQGKRSMQDHDLGMLATLANELQNPEKQAQVALRQANYAMVTDDYTAAVKAAQQAIDRAQTSTSEAMATITADGYLQWGRALRSQGRYQEATPRLQQALEHARLAQATQIEAECLRNIGAIAFYEGDYDVTRKKAEEALPIFEAIDDQRGKAYLLIDLANAMNVQGLFNEAMPLYEQAKEIMSKIGDQRGLCITLGNLGVCLFDQYEYAKARVYYEQAVVTFRMIGNHQSEAWAQGNLGFLHQSQGQYTYALVCNDKAVTILRAIDDKQDIGWALSNTGLLYLDLGAYTQAEQIFQEALDACIECGDRVQESEVLTGIARLWCAREEYPQAYTDSMQAREIARSTGAKLETADAQLVVGHALEGLERFDEAHHEYQHALDIWLAEHAPPYRDALAGIARCLLAWGNREEAMVKVDQILASLANGVVDGIVEPLRVYQTCYQVLQTAGDERASEVMHAAYALLQQRAATLAAGSPLRESYLSEVRVNREWLAEFEKHSLVWDVP